MDIGLKIVLILFSEIVILLEKKLILYYVFLYSYLFLYYLYWIKIKVILRNYKIEKNWLKIIYYLKNYILMWI